MGNKDNDNVASREVGSSGSFSKWKWGEKSINLGKNTPIPKMYAPKKDKNGVYEFKPDFQ